MLGKFILSLALVCPVVIAKPVHVKSSRVSFTATGNPGFLTIEGHGAELSGLDLKSKDGAVIGEVYVGLRRLTTDMELRDRHLHKKYLDTRKYPKARLEFTGINGAFIGELTLKGVSKKVAGRYNLKGSVLTASFKVNIKDYPIGVPSWLGVTVAETVDIRVEAKL